MHEHSRAEPAPARAWDGNPSCSAWIPGRASLARNDGLLCELAMERVISRRVRKRTEFVNWVFTYSVPTLLPRAQASHRYRVRLE